MATKFYLRDIATTLSGTLPSGEQAGATANFTFSNSTQLSTLSTSPGTTQTSSTVLTTATSVTAYVGMWLSDPLAGGQTVGGGSINLFCGQAESSASQNFLINGINAYIWRPSNGTKVGTIRDSTGAALDTTEAGTSETVQYISGITSAGVVTQAGDVLVIELWALFSPAMTASYTGTIYYNGTVESTTDGAAISDAATYVELAENVLFLATGTLDVTQAGNTISSTILTKSAAEYLGIEIQKLAPSAIIELFELDASSLTDSNGQPGELVRFHAGTNGLMQPLVWQGNTYTPFPVELSGFEATGKGTIPRPIFRVANIEGSISALLYAFDDLIGAPVTRKRTFSKFLDSVNFSTANPFANPEAAYPDEVFYISRKSKENHLYVEFELSPLWDLHGIKLPKRLCIQNVCAWKYKGLECGYGSIPEVVNASKPYTATMVNSALEVTFTWTAHPAVLDQAVYIDFGIGYEEASNSYSIVSMTTDTFTILVDYTISVPASGTAKITNRFNLADIPIYTELQLDNCSRRLNACNKRFGPNSVLPYGGFPGVGWVR